MDNATIGNVETFLRDGGEEEDTRRVGVDCFAHELFGTSPRPDELLSGQLRDRIRAALLANEDAVAESLLDHLVGLRRQTPLVAGRDGLTTSRGDANATQMLPAFTHGRLTRSPADKPTRDRRQHA